MRILPPPEPSLAVAFFCAPLVAPVLAIPASVLLPGMYASIFDVLVALPFVVVAALFHAYAGMLLVCLPIIGALKLMRRLDAVRLCSYTTLVGTIAWTCVIAFDASASLSMPDIGRYVLVNAICSFGVSAFFCVLGGVRLWSQARPPVHRRDPGRTRFGT